MLHLIGYYSVAETWYFYKFYDEKQQKSAKEVNDSIQM